MGNRFSLWETVFFGMGVASQAYLPPHRQILLGFRTRSNASSFWPPSWLTLSAKFSLLLLSRTRMLIDVSVGIENHAELHYRDHLAISAAILRRWFLLLDGTMATATG